jgi:hypothetical protein
MKTLQAISLTAVLLAGPATGFAAVGSEQAREANARNAAGGSGQTTHTTTPTSPTMSSPNVPSHDGNQQLGYSASPPAKGAQPSGVTVGPGSTDHGGDHPLGYAKGAGENSAVGK